MSMCLKSTWGACKRHYESIDQMLRSNGKDNLADTALLPCSVGLRRFGERNDAIDRNFELSVRDVFSERAHARRVRMGAEGLRLYGGMKSGVLRRPYNR